MTTTTQSKLYRCINHRHSVIPFYDFNKEERRLIVTFLTGYRYEYLNVPASKFFYLNEARNKTQFIREKIIPKYHCIALEPISLEDIKRITQPKTTFYKTNLSR